MREIRPSGSECGGGETLATPYLINLSSRAQSPQNRQGILDCSLVATKNAPNDLILEPFLSGNRLAYYTSNTPVL